MAEKTGIAWTTSSWNPWIGCTEVSPGCDNCYARVLDKRHRWGGGTHWGAGVPRRRTSADNWKEPVKWNKKQSALLLQHTWQRGPALVGQDEASALWTVFPSLCDPFDNEVPEAWRSDLFDLIYATPLLTWLLLTKRIGNVARLGATAMPQTERPGCLPPNVWLGVSVVNQEEADRDIPKLLATPAAKRFVSYEPALGPVDWWQVPVPGTHGDMCDLRTIDWIIVGGESKQGKAQARPFDLAWARSTVAQCKAASVSVFVKQLGSHAITDVQRRPGWGGKLYSAFRLKLDHRAGADPAEWPEDLRVQEFPPQ
jgi:protein gp37